MEELRDKLIERAGKANTPPGSVKDLVTAAVSIDNQILTRKAYEYPSDGGDVVVIGPEAFMSKDGKVLCYKGQNFVPQKPPKGAKKKSG